MEIILLKNDFNGALNALLENMVNNHIEECKEKYSTKTKEQFKVDLSCNEDLTTELENIEKMISRDLSSKEMVIFKYLFNHSLTRDLYRV
jgi:sugar diacid utilization regulator